MLRACACYLPTLLMRELRLVTMASNEPVILLPQDAFHCPLHYEVVLAALRDDGSTVLAPELPTTGTDPRLTYEDDIAALGEALEPLLSEGKEVFIVVHCFGFLPPRQCIKGEIVAERRD